MPRVKGGTIHRARRKKVMKLAKGYFGSKHRLYKTAHEQVMHSLAYSYRDRRQRKRDFRKLEKMYFLFFKIKLLLLDLKIEKDNGKCPVKL